jgi:hypothetical protein
VTLGVTAIAVRGRWIKHTYPGSQMPRELWTWQVDVEVADLSTPEYLTKIGLELRRTSDITGTN